MGFYTEVLGTRSRVHAINSCIVMGSPKHTRP